MHLNLSFLAMSVIAAPVLAAKTWDVNIVNGLFSPQQVNIAPGDTVRWPNNDGGDHAIVETNTGIRTCNSKSGGFNSGRLTSGKSYQRIFLTPGTVNYKDGIGANCMKGATGTIYISNSTRPSGSPTQPMPSPSSSHTAAPISSPTNAANSLSVEKSLLLGVVCFIGALAL